MIRNHKNNHDKESCLFSIMLTNCSHIIVSLEVCIIFVTSPLYSFPLKHIIGYMAYQSVESDIIKHWYHSLNRSSLIPSLSSISFTLAIVVTLFYLRWYHRSCKLPYVDYKEMWSHTFNLLKSHVVLLLHDF